MKEETKNEMDLLLRRLGRREKPGLSASTESHLDADELSAYAENALPAAARARYTAHLAECSRCRELMVQLSSAVGVVVATDNANVAKPSAWRTFLASLFTPMVLRYAAPALGLIVVAAIGFVVLRREQPSARYVTQVTNNEQGPTPLPSTQPGAEANPEQPADKLAKNQPAAQTAPMTNAPPVVSSVDADVSKDKAEQPKPEPRTATANEPPPAPKTEPKTEPTPEPKSEPTATREVSQKPADTEAAKKEVDSLSTLTPATERQSRAESRRDAKGNFARAPKAATDTDRVGVGTAAGSVGKIKDDNLSANTRSVAGRRFQKKGGVWIDTAYDSSKDSVTLTRGSEQYRALVADEPAIKTIADELDGEIIVVWKGHTYRIR